MRDNMDIAHIMKPSKAVGSSTQAILMQENMDSLIPVSTDLVKGKTEEGYVKVPTNYGRDIVFPVAEVKNALDKLQPDLVLVHTLASDFVAKIAEITQQYPTAWRMAVNPLELYINRNQRSIMGSTLIAIDNVDVVIPGSEHVRKNMKRMGVKNVSEIIPPMIDLDKWKDVREEPNDSHNTIISATRLSPIKNLHTSIFAARDVLNKHPNAEYKIYGAGQDMKYLENLKNRLGSNRIEIMGHKKPRDIYSEGDIYLQTSISENNSLSVLEARASGLPTVCSDIRGHDSNNKFPHDAIYEFSDELDELLSDRNYYDNRREEATMNLDKYHPDNVIPQYEELFETMTNMKEFKQLSKQLWGVKNE